MKTFGRKEILRRTFVLDKIVHAPSPRIADVNPGAPDELQKIVRRCLQKDPERRYQSIKDVAIELDDLVQELNVEPDHIVQTASIGKASRGSEPRSAVERSAHSAASTAEGGGARAVDRLQDRPHPLLRLVARR